MDFFAVQIDIKALNTDRSQAVEIVVGCIEFERRAREEDFTIAPGGAVFEVLGSTRVSALTNRGFAAQPVAGVELWLEPAFHA